MSDMKYRYSYDDDTDEIYRVHVERDDEPFNPRKEFDGFCAKIYAENRSYNLSDDDSIKSVDEAKQQMIVEAGITDEQIIDYVKSGKTDLELKYDEESEEWELYGEFDTFLQHYDHGLIASQADITWLIDEIIESLSLEDLTEISNGNLVAKPLCIEERYYNPYLDVDVWTDGTYDGCIWITKNDLEKVGYILEKGKTWEQALQEDLDVELKEFNLYLQDEVYGWVEEKCVDYDDPDDDSSWEQGDSVWGYITENEDEVLDEWGRDYDTNINLDELITKREGRLKNVRFVVTVDTEIKLTPKQYESLKNDERFCLDDNDEFTVYGSIKCGDEIRKIKS